MKNQYYFHSPQQDGEQRMTVAGLRDPETNVITLGIAKCSLQDTFSKAKGRELAINRAAKAELGQIVIGKNRHVGIAFRLVAQGIISSMMSASYKHNKGSETDV